MAPSQALIARLYDSTLRPLEWELQFQVQDLLPLHFGELCVSFIFYKSTNMNRGCRIRMCIFATTSWPDIHRLMKMIVHVGHKTQVDGIKPITFDPSLDSRTDPIDPTVEKQCDAVDEDLLRYVDELSLIRSRVDGKTSLTKEDVEVVEAGVQGLQKYGIGPCSARWFYGSFDIFIQLERRLASLYPSILAQSGKCRGMSALALSSHSSSDRGAIH